MRCLLARVSSLAVGLAVYGAVALPALPAQLVPVRTVPVASGDQFLLMPGDRVGMGGVRLAVRDTLGDPWSHPALGAALTESAFLVSPTLYGISRDGGGGRSLPLGVLLRGARWFGGAAVALQQVDDGPGPFGGGWFGEPLPPVRWDGPEVRLLRDRSHRNLFAQGFVGRSLGRGPWSVGVGLSVAALDALDGVDLLYANAVDIEQSGSRTGVRVGLHRNGPRDLVDVVVVHDRVSMTHDVTYVDWLWAPDAGAFLVPRVEVNGDETRTWGGQVAWTRRLDAPGWRLGASATVNRKDHPKIPDYEIQGIPRDPGETWAWDLGVGLSHRDGPTLFAVDVAFQPIWTDTWQVADTAEVGPTGRRVAAGARTVENDFFFTNVVLRAGVEYRPGRAAVQAGVEVRSYDYELRQQDNRAGSVRHQDEAWMEWTPTVGASYRFAGLDLRYAGRVTTGTGRPGTAFDGWFLEGDAAPGVDFLAAPRGPLTLQDATVVTHQVSVRVPIR